MDFIVNIFVLSVINISCEMKYIKMKICVRYCYQITTLWYMTSEIKVKYIMTKSVMAEYTQLLFSAVPAERLSA